MVKSATQIIDEIGAAEFAKAVGITENYARVMKHRDRFPREKWPEITAAFPELTQERLLRIEQAGARKAASRSKAA